MVLQLRSLTLGLLHAFGIGCTFFLPVSLGTTEEAFAGAATTATTIAVSCVASPFVALVLVLLPLSALASVVSVPIAVVPIVAVHVAIGRFLLCDERRSTLGNLG